MPTFSFFSIPANNQLDSICEDSIQSKSQGYRCRGKIETHRQINISQRFIVEPSLTTFSTHSVHKFYRNNDACSKRINFTISTVQVQSGRLLTILTYCTNKNSQLGPWEFSLQLGRWLSCQDLWFMCETASYKF